MTDAFGLRGIRVDGGRALAFGLTVCGFLAVAVASGGSIDTTGATLAPGDAPVQGAVTIDDAADLGVVPSLELDTGLPEDVQRWHHDAGSFGGLGGPDFHATVDVTLPAGTYNFGKFTVDKGVTVTFPGQTTLQAAGAARIEGRLEFQQPMNCFLDFGRNLTIVGRDDPVTTGIYAPSGTSWVAISVHGDLAISADAGARVELGAGDEGGDAILAGGIQMNFSCDGAGTQRVSGATLDAVGFNVAGDLVLDGCSGRRVEADAFDGAVTITGGSFDATSVRAAGDIGIQDATIGSLLVETPDGGLRVSGSSAVGATTGVSVQAHGDVVFEDGVAVTGPALSVGSVAGKIYLGDGTRVDGGGSTENPWGFLVDGWTGVELAGSLSSGGAWNDLMAGNGDVVLDGGASIDAPGGFVWLWAAGSVTAEGGTATLSASEFDVRSVTGDLDLDVASMTATGGPIVALTNGTVRLRGDYSAARDVQVLSRKDAIDVSGATLATTDAGPALSGFVRLAAYASNATVDASYATLRTGSSDAQSGDLLLQVAASGGEMAEGAIKVKDVAAVQTPEGVVTTIRGTIAATRRGVDLRGSSLLSAGDTSGRLFLRPRRGRLTGDAAQVGLRTAGGKGARRPFTLELREPSATEGEETTLRLDHAGFHAHGTFRRPAAR